MDEGILVPTSVKEGEASDELLAALSDLAYSNAPQQVPEKTKHASKFFFKLGQSLDMSVKQRAKKFVPKKMEHIDDVVVKRLKDYKEELPPQLTGNISTVREFFLTELGPLTLAGGAGTIQAREVAQRLLNTEIDAGQFDKFERMSRIAANMRMARFIAEYYKLPRSAALKILEELAPRPPASIPIPTPYESRHAKARKEIAEISKKAHSTG